MRYHDPRLLQRLAAEYVLGTLEGRARRRFEVLMTDSHQVRTAVWGWEQRLSPLAQAARSVQPRPQVWRKVLARTGAGASEPRWYERLRLWQGLTLAATAAALVLGVMLRLTSVPAQEYVAVFNGEQLQPLWVVRADARSGRLEIRSIEATAPASNNSYELWLLPAGGAAPRSMGLLPVGDETIRTQLPGNVQSLLQTAQGLAISLEPAGGSPTDVPTGPVVYQAALITI